MLLVRSVALLALMVAVFISFKTTNHLVEDRLFHSPVLHTCRSTFQGNPPPEPSVSPMPEQCSALVKDVLVVSRDTESAYLFLLFAALAIAVSAIALLLSSRRVSQPAP